MKKIIKAISVKDKKIVKALLFAGELISGYDIFQEMFNEGTKFYLVSKGQEYELKLDKNTNLVIEPPSEVLSSLNTMI